MSRFRLDSLRSQREQAVAAIDALDAKCAAESRELTDAEQTESDALFARTKALDEEIAPLAERQQALDAGAAVLARATAGRPPATTPAARRLEQAEVKLPTAGEYLSAFFRATENGDEAAREFIARAVADQTTGDNPGILPKEIVGNLLKFADSSRPVFSSFTSRPMPAKGKTFSRPRVTQRVLIDEQSAEKTQLASRKMTIAGEDVTKRTFGGVLDISQQDIDWTEPALLDIVLADFTDMYAEVSEAEAVDFLIAKATNTDTWTGTNVGTIVSSITGGVQTAYNQAKRMPNTFWLSLDAAMGLAGTTNTDNSVTAISMIRQALKDVGVNLEFVVGPQLPADTRILGNSGLVETYEQRKGLLQAINVPLLGWDVGYAAYLAFYGRAEGLVSLEAA